MRDTVIEQGEYTIVQTTNNHIHIYKNNKLVYHASCTKKKMEAELLKHLEFYKNFTVKDADGNTKFDKIYEESEAESK